MKHLMLPFLLLFPLFTNAQVAIDTIVSKACNCFENGNTKGFSIEDTFPECVYQQTSSNNVNYKQIRDDLEMSDRDLDKAIVHKLIFECDAAFDFYNKNLISSLDSLVRIDLDDLETTHKRIEKRPLAETYAERGMIYLFIEKDYSKALEDLNTAVALDDKNEAVYAFRGIYYQKMGNWEMAIADYKKALEYEDDEPIFHVFLYVAQRNLKRMKGKE